MQTFTFTVPNTGNPTTITISSSMSSNNFTPSSCSASGTMQLTVLHLDPVINTATMVETNSVLTALNVPNTTIVRYLSKKTITLNVTTYDSATPSYRLRHLNSDYALPSSTTYQSSNVFTNVDYTTHDVAIGDGKANLIQDIKDSLNGTATDWVYVSINGTAQKPNGIAYTKPTIERANTSIKRKSGSGTTLTDNKAVLNLKAKIYKTTTDVIGNSNNIQQIGYKIWEQNSSEPSNYTTLSPTIDSNGNVTVNGVEITNKNYTKTYYYKIIIKDRFGYQDIVEGSLPTGQSVWTEYKDRVDFLNVTKQGKEIYLNIYSNNEKIVGEWLNGESIYRKVINLGNLPNATTKTITHNISNLGQFTNISGLAIRSNDNDTLPIPYVTFNANNSGGITIYVDNTNVTVRTTTDRSSYEGYVILEYTKTTD